MISNKTSSTPTASKHKLTSRLSSCIILNLIASGLLLTSVSSHANLVVEPVKAPSTEVAKAKLHVKAMILPFEFVDETNAPLSADITRTSSIAPSIQKSLEDESTTVYVFKDPKGSDYFELNESKSYLMRHPEEVVKLGRQTGVDIVILGENRKASGMYTYLTTMVLDVKAGKTIGFFQRELKGTNYSGILTDVTATEMARDTDSVIKKTMLKNKAESDKSKIKPGFPDTPIN